MPAGDYVLEIRSLEHEDITDTLKIGDKEITTLRYELQKSEAVKEIEEVSIVGQDQSKRTNIDMSVNKLDQEGLERLDRKSTRLNSSHVRISYAVFCLKKKKKKEQT